MLTVRALDASGDSVTRTLQITVTDVNEAPTDLVLLRASAITAPTAPYGTIRVTDPDSGETFAFVLDDDALGQFVLDPASGTLAANPACSTSSPPASPTIVVTATDSAGHPITRAIQLRDPPRSPTPPRRPEPPPSGHDRSVRHPPERHPVHRRCARPGDEGIGPGDVSPARFRAVDVPLEISRDGGIRPTSPPLETPRAASNQRAARSQRVGIGDERQRVLDTTTWPCC
ncbi:MAG: cadherin repeat domain-containing protein [Burkholderiaceae bacterium]